MSVKQLSSKGMYKNADQFLDDINEYVFSCQTFKKDKLRIDGSDELKDVNDINGHNISYFYKIPTITGFCYWKGISRQTFYYYKSLNKDFEKVVNYFENIITNCATEEALLDKDRSRGAEAFIRQRESVKNRENQRELERLEVEKKRAELETIKAKGKLMEAQISRIASGKIDNPYINAFLQDLGEGLGSSYIEEVLRGRIADLASQDNGNSGDKK